MTPLRLPPIYPIIDDTFISLDRMEKTSRTLIDGGAEILQLRAKNLSPTEFLKAARLIGETTKKSKVIFVVNDRIDIALLSDADGVHLGQDDMPVKEARKLLGPESIIGFSTHNVGEAVAAEKLPIDYISFGPLFPTTTKGDADTPKGIKGLSQARKSVHLPIVAIGGITEKRIAEVLNSGANSVAMISDILLSTDMEAKMKSLITMGEKKRG